TSVPYTLSLHDALPILELDAEELRRRGVGVRVFRILHLLRRVRIRRRGGVLPRRRLATPLLARDRIDDRLQQTRKRGYLRLRLRRRRRDPFRRRLRLRRGLHCRLLRRVAEREELAVALLAGWSVGAPALGRARHHDCRGFPCRLPAPESARYYTRRRSRRGR